MNVDIQKIREDFPILSRTVYGKPLVYFDNGATTQKPRLVVDALVDEYYSVNANVHRGVHYLSQQATELHEASRETVREFINAHSTNEVVFTRGTTESINLLVSSFGDEFMEEGDEVIVSVMEHHSNIVPWQLLAARKGIAIKVIPMNDKAEIRRTIILSIQRHGIYIDLCLDQGSKDQCRGIRPIRNTEKNKLKRLPHDSKRGYSRHGS